MHIKFESNVVETEGLRCFWQKLMIPSHGIPGKVMVFANATFHVLEFCEVMEFDLPTIRMCLLLCPI